MSSSSSHFGSYPSTTDAASFSELYASPHASSATISAYLLPTGGLVSRFGPGGAGELPLASYSQSARPAESHALLVLTPDVHPNLDTLAVLVQRYDGHGFSDVSSGAMTITATLSGASPISLVTYHARGPQDSQWTRRYSTSVPATWFEVTDPGGSVVTITSRLAGKDTHTVSFRVYGTPTWFGQRANVAGISAYATRDVAGTTPAETMRVGDSFYMQLYGHTGGQLLSSFEVKFIEDPAVCTLVPTSGSISGSYVGTVQGELSGEYSTELLKRSQDLEDASVYFTKYSRFGKLSYLQSIFGHLGYVRLTMVGTGNCLVSAKVTSFYYDGGTTWIPGVANGDLVTLHGNAVAQYVDSTVGVFGQLATSTPVLNTAFLSGVSLEVSVRALLFSSADWHTSTTSSISIGESQASGSVTAIVSAGSFSHAVNFTVVRLSVPTLQVEDSELQALPGSCVGFQSTRLQAVSDEVDIARLLTFQTSFSHVAQIDASVLPRPMVVGVGAGTAQVYVKDISFTSVTVEVKTAVVAVSSLSAGVVTGVEWSSSSSAAGPFLPMPSHEFF